MANTTALKRRITSVKNTKQITKAMELVAASKRRKAQEQATRTSDYSRAARSILSRLRELTDVSSHPLFSVRPVAKRLLIVITSDRGLAGAYNSNILRLLTKELKKDQAEGVATDVIVVGKQAARFVSRVHDINIVAVYSDFPEQPAIADIKPILDTSIQKFDSSFKDAVSKNQTQEDEDGPHETAKTASLHDMMEQVDAVDVLYTQYQSSVSQVAITERILPAAFDAVNVSADLEKAIFEPSVKEVLNSTTYRLIEAELTQIFYESQASEHSMRMMAMKSATDNAGDLIDDLTLAFNTARQSGITQEIAEITGGAEAIQ